MKPNKQRREGKGPFELLEEAFHLLRLAPASLLAVYYVGAFPFVLALLFFWSDMSRSALAQQRLAVGAFGLSLFFFWMKTWQAVFAQALLARLSGEPAPRWTGASLLRIGLAQAIVQPSGLFVLPVSLIVLFPFGWTYAFYQNVTALGNGQDGDLRELVKRAWRQARLWPLQNHHVLFLLQPFALFVFLNLGTGVLAVPFVLSKFLGVETVFSLSMSATLNTTFLAAILGLTYLCLDPVLKAIYALRCFYGESLQSGRDLKAELNNLQPQPASARAMVVLILLLSFTATAGRSADSPTEQPVPKDAAQVSQPAVSPISKSAERSTALRDTLSPPDLDRSIEEVLRQREFSWRFPREKISKEDTKKGMIATFLESVLETLQNWLKAVGRWVEDVLRWLRKYLFPRQGAGGTSGTGWISTLYVMLWVVAIALVCALVFLLFRTWQNWRRPASAFAAEAIVPVPDLADENVGADELPEAGWLKVARELLEKGDLRLALRAFYLASLARLAEGNLITIAKFKSNRDYERELRRRAHAFPEVLSTFAQNVSTFDRVWYGLHEVNRELLEQFSGNVERIRLV